MPLAGEQVTETLLAEGSDAMAASADFSGMISKRAECNRDMGSSHFVREFGLPAGYEIAQLCVDGIVEFR